MKKHAYLIICHHEPEVLQLLVNAIDDLRNDIYIHFDKKFKASPYLQVRYSKLFVLEKRIDVRWGDYSQIKAELLLFESAFRNSSYSYYHLLSGVDFPIKSQNYIHSFFEKNNGMEFIGFTQGNVDDEIDQKVRRFHLFPKEYRNTEGVCGLLIRGLRKGFLKLQKLIGLRRNKNIVFKKGTNWVSVTSNFVEFLLSQKEVIERLYTYTFCADEVYKQTLCWNSSFKNNVYDLYNSGNSSKRMIQWVNNVLVDWDINDVDYLFDSTGLFARKFSNKNIEVVKRIFKKVQL